MVSTLRKSKEVTIFAPTNSIFEKLMEDMPWLFFDKTSIVNFIKRRIIPKRVAIRNLGDGVTQETSVNGNSMNITRNGKEIITETTDDESIITMADISAQNGNINIVDTTS